MKACSRKVFLIVVFSLLISSCGIPLFYTGTEIVNSRVYGQRFDKNGIIISHIEYRNIRHKIYWLISVQGPGLQPIDFGNYFLIAHEKTQKLSHIENFGILDLLDQFFPVQDSDLWIAFQLTKVRGYKADIRMTLFDERKRYQDEIVPDCIQTCITKDCYNKVSNYNIKLSPDNKHISFTTRGGNVSYEIADHKLIRKLE